MNAVPVPSFSARLFPGALMAVVLLALFATLHAADAPPNKVDPAFVPSPTTPSCLAC